MKITTENWNNLSLKRICKKIYKKIYINISMQNIHVPRKMQLSFFYIDSAFAFWRSLKRVFRKIHLTENIYCPNKADKRYFRIL